MISTPGTVRWRAGKARGAALCHPGSVTYDPGRHWGERSDGTNRGGGRVPVLRNEWREPLRAQRDPVAGDSGRTRSNRDDRQQWRKQTWLGRFLSTYGWRAYALPVLIVLTAVVVYQTITGIGTTKPVDDAGPIQGPPTIDPVSTAIVGAPPKGMTQFDANLPTGILPDGGPYTEAGTKTWHIVP
ncbi:MAG: hypothetical protein QOH54_1669, partial [Mycobacterium sp.]|nr:hypothetical protein [Mycobacterium sp.]